MAARVGVLGLKFWHFVDLGPLDRVVRLVFSIGEPFCTDVKEEATTVDAYGGAWRSVASQLDLKFSGLVDLGP